MDKPVTLITGTRKGIGRFLAEHYLAQGHFVVGCSRGESDLEDENYKHFCADVACEAEVKVIFKFIRKELGSLHNLLNNAGIASMNHIMLTPTETVNNIFNTNVMGTFLFCREAARIMQKSGYGRIVNFTPVATALMLEGEAVYAASKAAVLSFTQVMAREIGDFGITVNSVGPTPVMTDLIKNVPKEKMDALLAQQAINRFGTFEDVLNVIEFFLKEDSGFVTSQNIYLGGVA